MMRTPKTEGGGRREIEREEREREAERTVMLYSPD